MKDLHLSIEDGTSDPDELTPEERARLCEICLEPTDTPPECSDCWERNRKRFER